MKSMFLDPGDGTGIPKKKVVLILNAETATLSATTRQFIRKMSEKKQSIMPKKMLSQVNSLILTNSHGKDFLYSSAKRAKSLVEED